MKLTRSLLAVALSFSLSLLTFIALPVHSVNAQDSTVALQRGFRFCQACIWFILHEVFIGKGSGLRIVGL